MNPCTGHNLTMATADIAIGRGGNAARPASDAIPPAADLAVPNVFLAGNHAAGIAAATEVAEVLALPCEILGHVSALVRRGEFSPGCAVLATGDIDGECLDLLERIRRLERTTPVLVVTAVHSPPSIVAAMRRGAFAVHPLTGDDADLLVLVQEAIADDLRLRARRQRDREVRRIVGELTPRERAVLDLVIAGEPNKTIACRLDVSVRTVENRRHDLFLAFGVTGAVQLATLICGAFGGSMPELQTD